MLGLILFVIIMFNLIRVSHIKFPTSCFKIKYMTRLKFRKVNLKRNNSRKRKNNKNKNQKNKKRKNNRKRKN